MGSQKKQFVGMRMMDKENVKQISKGQSVEAERDH